MIIDKNKKPWSCLKMKTIKKQLTDKKREYETRLKSLKIMYTNAKTNDSRISISSRFDYLMHKLKAINRRIVLLEGKINEKRS